MKMILLVARMARLRALLVVVLTVQLIVHTHAQSDSDPQRGTRQNIPDIELVDQDGKRVHLYADLVKGRVAALSFIFTTCTTICPLIGANLGRLQTELGQSQGQSLGEDISLISVSVDPATDTPQRMKAWGVQFGAKPGWSLLTGNKETVEQLLKTLGLFTSDVQSHSPFLLLVNDRTGEWTRVNAIETPSPVIAQILRKMAETAGNPHPRLDTEQTSVSAAKEGPGEASPAERYFGDAVLTNQDGKQLRLYTDILKGNVVIINSFYSTCSGVCRVTIPVFKQLQDDFGERVGKDVRLVSITVDPESDTPAVLKQYAAGVGARPGWDFLTGDKQTVNQVLYKLGLYAEAKEDHSNVFIVGNEPTGLWKKVLGIAPPYEIRRSVESVLGDQK